MSDLQLQAVIGQMETWLADPGWDPDPEAMTLWNQQFEAAVATAERGPGWAALVRRAHELGARVEVRTQPMVMKLQELQGELAAQAKGSRALKGYRSGLN
jgi:hypothetical protein